MKAAFIRLLFVCVFLGAVLPGQAQETKSAGPAGRETLINFGWKFFKGDEPQASQAAFNDATWRNLDLPHDWSIEGPFDVKWGSCTAYLPGGIGWYRKSFDVPAEVKDKQIAIRFDGVYQNSEVWCNGKLVGQRPYGYISFQYDLTPYLNFGGKNVIAVRVDHTKFADSRWYTGSGIYRNVWLVQTDKVHLAPWGVFVSSPDATSVTAGLAIQSFVKNDTSASVDVTVVSVVKNSHGDEVGTAQGVGTIAPGGQVPFPQTLTVTRPELWSVEQPVLYTMVTQVKLGGKVVDEMRTPFGIRSIAFDADRGFFLNGKNMKIKGVCVHHDAGALGAAVPAKVWERRLNILKEAGTNAIRMSHNPPDPQLLDLCDRMGFLVMDEAFDEWTAGKKKWTDGHNVSKWTLDGYHDFFDKWADTDLRDMVLRDRNHPSIIMWSIGNEIDYPNDPYPLNTPLAPPIAEQLIKDIKELDTSRPVTAACAAIASNKFYYMLDIVGYNYQEQRYPADHKARPQQVIYGSENSQGVQQWMAVANNAYISGQFLWTGVDFLGEAPAWPARGSSAGFLDLAGFKKPNFYLRQSLWSDKPMVYLTTAGARMGRGAMMGGGMGGGPSVTCYTNCQSVELFQDGKSLGEKAHTTTTQMLTWPVTPAQGTLKAVGKKGGKEVCSFELKKAGAAKKLVILPDVRSLAADGQDVAQIEVQVTDEEGSLVNNSVAPTSGTLSAGVAAATPPAAMGQGAPVTGAGAPSAAGRGGRGGRGGQGGGRGGFAAPNAAPAITCTLSGPGRILGIENGDQRSHEDYQANVHKPYQGRMLVFVQAQRGQQGEITLSVASPGLEGASTKLAVK